MLASLKNAADKASVTLGQISSTAQTLQVGLAPDAPLTYRLQLALENFSEASSAIRELADHLQRNPSAIVRGKYVSEGETMSSREPGVYFGPGLYCAEQSADRHPF